MIRKGKEGSRLFWLRKFGETAKPSCQASIFQPDSFLMQLKSLCEINKSIKKNPTTTNIRRGNLGESATRISGIDSLVHGLGIPVTNFKATITLLAAVASLSSPPWSFHSLPATVVSSFPVTSVSAIDASFFLAHGRETKPLPTKSTSSKKWRVFWQADKVFRQWARSVVCSERVGREGGGWEWQRFNYGDYEERLERLTNLRSEICSTTGRSLSSLGFFAAQDVNNGAFVGAGQSGEFARASWMERCPAWIDCSHCGGYELGVSLPKREFVASDRMPRFFFTDPTTFCRRCTLLITTEAVASTEHRRGHGEE